MTALQQVVAVAYRQAIADYLMVTKSNRSSWHHTEEGLPDEGKDVTFIVSGPVEPFIDNGYLSSKNDLRTGESIPVFVGAFDTDGNDYTYTTDQVLMWAYDADLIKDALGEDEQ